MQLSDGTHAKCSEELRTPKRRKRMVFARRCDVAVYGPGCMAHVARPSHIEQEGRVLNSPAAGRVRTDTADAQAHANLQKTRTMNTTTLFLLLIQQIVRKFSFFPKKCNIINSFTPGVSKGAFEQGTEKLLKTGKKWVRKGCF